MVERIRITSSEKSLRVGDTAAEGVRPRGVLVVLLGGKLNVWDGHRSRHPWPSVRVGVGWLGGNKRSLRLLVSCGRRRIEGLPLGGILSELLLLLRNSLKINSTDYTNCPSNSTLENVALQKE